MSTRQERLSRLHELLFGLGDRESHDHGIAEEKSQDNGTERMFVGVVDGKIVRQAIECHIETDEIPVSVIEAIRQAFDLNSAEVTDEDFYGKKRT